MSTIFTHLWIVSHVPECWRTSNKHTKDRFRTRKSLVNVLKTVSNVIFVHGNEIYETFSPYITQVERVDIDKLEALEALSILETLFNQQFKLDCYSAIFYNSDSWYLNYNENIFSNHLLD